MVTITLLINTRYVTDTLTDMQEVQMDGWTLAMVSYSPDVAVQNMSSSPEFTRFTATADLSAEETVDRIVYFISPSDYLGAKHTSYGGHLNYSITYSTGIFGKINFNYHFIINRCNY